MIKTNSISLLFLFLLFITTACQENQESTPLETQVLAKKSFLKGTLEDGNIKSISYDEEAININEDGTFSFETELKYATLGYLTVNGDQNEVFLSPGKTTSLSITKDGLQFSGDLETENGQLMSDKKINAKLGSYLENNWYSIHTKPEEEFLTIIDSVKGLFLSSMEKTNAEHGLSEEFMATNQASLNYSFDRMILRYPEWYKRFTGQDIQLSEQALSSIQSKTDAPQFQSLDSYEKYVRTYWDKEIQKRFAQQKDTSIYFGKQKTDIALQMINEQFKNKEAIDYWTFEFIKNHIDSYTWVNGKVYLDDFMANCTTPAVCNEAKDFEQELLAEREGHDIQIYKSPKGYQLEAHIFKPENFNASNTYAALAAFHGGGWVQGHASWTFESAKHAAENGLIGIAVEYRLSNYEDVTPQEAMQDTRDAIQWIRANAANLSIDSNKIIGKGISAGGHLISSISVLQDEDDSDLPNALILFSPAIDTKDGYFVDLLHEGVDPISVSALDNLKSGLKMPRTLILQGETDSLTPTIHAQAFKEKMHTLGYDCQLKIYEDCGHLFTPSHLDDKGWPQSDPEKLRLSYIEQAKFYRELGYVR